MLLEKFNGGAVASHTTSRSPDLFPLIYFLGRAMKTIVQDTLINSEMNQVAQNFITAVMITETRGISENVHQTILRWCYACIHDNGGNFVHLF